MLRRHHGAQVVRVHLLGLAVLQPGGSVHDGEIHFIALQARAQLLHGVRDDGHVGFRVQGAVAGEHPGDQALPDGGGDAHGEVAHVLPVVFQSVTGVLLDVLHPAGVLRQDLALGGEDQFLLIVIKNLDIVFLLQLFDVIAGRRLGQRQGVGCLGITALFDDAQQGLHLRVDHGAAFSSPAMPVNARFGTVLH